MDEKVKIYLECLRLANLVSPPSDVVVRADAYYAAVLAKLAPGLDVFGKPIESSDVNGVAEQGEVDCR